MLASLVLVASLLQGTAAYFADWSQLARDKQPTCVEIPVNMTLCHNIGETMVRACWATASQVGPQFPT